MWFCKWRVTLCFLFLWLFNFENVRNCQQVNMFSTVYCLVSNPFLPFFAQKLRIFCIKLFISCCSKIWIHHTLLMNIDRSKLCLYRHARTCLHLSRLANIFRHARTCLHLSRLAYIFRHARTSLHLSRSAYIFRHARMCLHLSRSAYIFRHTRICLHLSRSAYIFRLPGDAYIYLDQRIYLDMPGHAYIYLDQRIYLDCPDIPTSI